MNIFNYLEYNYLIILSFFFISLISLILNILTKGKSNDLFFSTYRSSLLNPLTYLRLVTHIFGHANWSHFTHNFLYILLIGPMIEEKYGSLNLLIMILITATVIGLFNSIFTRNKILGASGITFMLIVLSSFVNLSFACNVLYAKSLTDLLTLIGLLSLRYLLISPIIIGTAYVLNCTF